MNLFFRSNLVVCCRFVFAVEKSKKIAEPESKESATSCVRGELNDLAKTIKIGNSVQDMVRQNRWRVSENGRRVEGNKQKIVKKLREIAQDEAVKIIGKRGRYIGSVDQNRRLYAFLKAHQACDVSENDSTSSVLSLVDMVEPVITLKRRKTPLVETSPVLKSEPAEEETTQVAVPSVPEIDPVKNQGAEREAEGRSRDLVTEQVASPLVVSLSAPKETVSAIVPQEVPMPTIQPKKNLNLPSRVVNPVELIRSRSGSVERSYVPEKVGQIRSVRFNENPHDADFFKVNGFDMKHLVLNKGSKTRSVRPNFGRGVELSSRARTLYEKTKTQWESRESKNGQSLQWYFAKVTQNGLQTLSQSKNPNKSFYGASVLKVPAAVRYADLKNEEYSRTDIERVAEAIAVSNNQQWNRLVQLPVNGRTPSKHQGRLSVGKFFQRYRQSYGVSKDGRMMTPKGSAKLARDLYMKKLSGSELVLKSMFSNHTGGMRIEKYFPRDVLVASKTGSWSGWNNEMSIIIHNGEPYVLSVFSQNVPGANEKIAALAGGLFRDYVSGDGSSSFESEPAVVEEEGESSSGYDYYGDDDDD